MYMLRMVRGRGGDYASAMLGSLIVLDLPGSLHLGWPDGPDLRHHGMCDESNSLCTASHEKCKSQASNKHMTSCECSCACFLQKAS